jgi:hypothetical protein
VDSEKNFPKFSLVKDYLLENLEKDQVMGLMIRKTRDLKLLFS